MTARVQSSTTQQHQKTTTEGVMTARVALVTGGTGGIGSAIVKHLAKQGHKVATNYRDEAKANAWVSQMKAQGVDAVAVKGDVSDTASAETMIKAVEDKLGTV